MTLYNKIRGMFSTAAKLVGPNFDRDVEYERDNAVRQYLIEKNRATHYEMQAQKWLLLAKRHQQFLDSKSTTDVGKIEEIESKE